MLSTAVAPGALQAATVSYLADIAQMSEGLDEPGFTVRHQCYSVRLLPPDLVGGRERQRGEWKGGMDLCTTRRTLPPDAHCQQPAYIATRCMHRVAADTECPLTCW